MSEQVGLVARAIAGARYALTGTAPTDWFGPGAGLPVQAPAEVAGRQFDYPSYVNLSYIPRKTEAVNFAKLKLLADKCNPLRIVMQRQILLAKSLEWKIKTRITAGASATVDPEVARIQAFFAMPDKRWDWPQWLGSILEQLYVYDAVSINTRLNLAGGIFGFEVLDGATITPLLGLDGRPPMVPEASYQQVIKGMVAGRFTDDELTYYPENHRVDRIYGYSRTEQIIDIAEATIARMKSQLGYFEHGNLGDGFFTAPVGTVAAQIVTLETQWNDLMTPSVNARRQLPFLPAGVEFHETKSAILQDQFDEWLVRLVCFPFGVSPNPFMKMTGLGSGDGASQHEVASEGGIAPTMEYIRCLMNRLISSRFKRPDLEFSWVEDREFDPKVAAEIDNIRLRNGSRTINEVRDRNGESKVEGGDTSIIYTSSGGVTLDAVLNPPAPVAPTLGGPGVGDPAASPDLGVDNAPADDVKKKSDELAKAATDKAIAKLQAAIAKYLTAKAGEIAGPLSDKLGLAKAEDDPSKRIDDALEEINWTWDDLPAIVQPFIAEIAVASGKASVEKLGLFDDETLKKVTARATRYAEDRSAELIGRKWVDGDLVDNGAWSIAETTRDSLRSLIAEAMERGDSNYDLAKGIREATTFDDARAMNIARTESATADVQGNIAGWKESGLVAGKEWLASEGACDECQDMDGKIVGIDEEFDGGDPPRHGHCECDVAPVLPEDMPDADGSDGNVEADADTDNEE